MIRIIVADDHKLFRAGLIRMLGDLPSITVVAEASDGDQALQAALSIDADVLILDLNMPGPTGVALIEQIHLLKPALPILVLSMHDEAATVRHALKSGASGYITKDVDPDTLMNATHKLARGERFVAPNLAVALAFSDQLSSAPAGGLSTREKEVLHLIAIGLPLTQIAERLCVSPKTVTTHKANLMGKLSIDNNSELIRYALENGFDK
jgi:DNA-binding NarL/FixJ family response regulator